MAAEPLEPWNGEEPEADAHSGVYLWWAALVCGFILAVGGQALAGHFASRPELAAADPGLVRLLGWSRWAGVALGLAGLAGLIRAARRG